MSAGGVADEWVRELLRQRDAKVFKNFPEAAADEAGSDLEAEPLGQRNGDSGTGRVVLGQFWNIPAAKWHDAIRRPVEESVQSRVFHESGRSAAW